MRRFLGICMIVAGFVAVFVPDNHNEGFLGDIRAGLQGKTGQSQPDGARQDQISGAAKVIDGDTLEIGALRIRLHGIDAPEQAQKCTTPSGKPWTCGRVATARLIARIQGRMVTCTGKERDRYDRLIATCQVEGEDIGAWMVQNGWAFAYRRYSGDYSSAEEDAHRRGLGIWTGTVQPPWDWRRAKNNG